MGNKIKVAVIGAGEVANTLHISLHGTKHLKGKGCDINREF